MCAQQPLTALVLEQGTEVRRRSVAVSRLNSRLLAGNTLTLCRANPAALSLLERTAAARGISARGQHRILRVARSIADLADRDRVDVTDLAEALSLRLPD